MSTSEKRRRTEDVSVPGILSHELPVQWERGRMIGSGGCGTVYLVTDKDNPDQELFVVKDIVITERNKDDITKQFKTETTILRTSETHPRIVQFFGYCQKDNIFSIFMQFLGNGSLTDYLVKNGKLLEPKAQRFTKQILEAVVFLHENNIIHRDIKGRNILLEDEDNIRLTDFGISKILTDVTSAYTVCIGTYRWMAPEVVTADGSTQKYNKKADIWSIGSTVVEMITGRDPYPQCKNEANVLFTIGQNKEPPKYPNVSALCETFLKKTFTVDPVARPTAKDLLDNDLFIYNGQTVSTATVPDKPQSIAYSFCKKNPGHEQFIPVKIFSMSHFPKCCQDNELFELMKAISELTVLVLVRFTSYDRPKTSSKTNSYPFYRNRGSDFLRTSTGMIDLEDCETLTDACNCKSCQRFTFNVVTATHVVFDESEAKNTEFKLFFNDDTSEVVRVYGVCIESCIDGGRFVEKLNGGSLFVGSRNDGGRFVEKTK